MLPLKTISTLGTLLLTAMSAAAAVPLAPHRAVYDLRLADRQPSMSDEATSMSGRMVYEFTGNACDGWTVNFRFVVQSTSGEDGSTLTDLRTSTHEEPDGTAFQFLSQTYTNQVLTEEVKGRADKSDAGVSVSLVMPAEAKLSFDRAVMFPTSHLHAILDAARAGRPMIVQEVFDGSETGDKAYRTSTVIGPRRTVPATGRDAEVGDLPRWPVTVAYFDLAAGGDAMPDYSISFDLWENGVSTSMRMDYGDFALDGVLAEYQPLPAETCDPAAPTSP